MIPITYAPVGSKHGVVFLDNGYWTGDEPIIPRRRRTRGRPALWVAVYYTTPLPIPQDGETLFHMSRHRNFALAEAALVRWLHGGRKAAGVQTCRMSRTIPNRAVFCTPSGHHLIPSDNDEQEVATPRSVDNSGMRTNVTSSTGSGVGSPDIEFRVPSLTSLVGNGGEVPAGDTTAPTRVALDWESMRTWDRMTRSSAPFWSATVSSGQTTNSPYISTQALQACLDRLAMLDGVSISPNTDYVVLNEPLPVEPENWEPNWSDELAIAT